MRVTVIFAGPDGKSHFRDEALAPGTERRATVFPRQPAGGWEISETPAGFRAGFGTTRKVRTLVVLEGALEIGVADETRIFQVGDVIHATDTTGEGHSSAVPGPGPVRVLNILSEAD